MTKNLLNVTNCVDMKLEPSASDIHVFLQLTNHEKHVEHSLSSYRTTISASSEYDY